MAAQRNLASVLDKLVEDHDAKIAANAAEAERQRKLQDAADKKTAESLLDRVESLVAEALNKGRTTAVLYENQSVHAELGNQTGVGKHLVALLRAAGLGDRLFVDIDISGGYVQQNSICLFLRRPK